VCQKTIELLTNCQLFEPLLHDICSLFRLLISRIEIEVNEFRTTNKSSRFRRLLTTVEELSTNDCVASLTVGFMPDYQALYSSVAPKYLPMILLKIVRDESKSLLSSFVASFDGPWKLFLFFSMATTDGLQDARLMASLLQTASSDVLNFVKQLFDVLSYPESANKVVLCKFLEMLVDSKPPALASEDAIAAFSGMFQHLRVPSFLVIRLVCEYVRAYPGSSVIAFQYQFTSSLNEIRSSSDELLKTLSFLCTVDPNVFLSLYSAKGLSALTRTFSLCEKSAVEYPRLITRFSSIDDSYNWTECVLSLLFDPRLFASTSEFLKELMLAVNSVAKKSDRFVPQLFEWLSTKTEAFWKRPELSGAKKIRLLAFAILSCDFDLFANRQQNINAVLVHCLSLENTEFVEFKAFSLLMRVLFVRFSVKIIESFASIMVNELTCGLTAGMQEMRIEAERLMRAALVAIPGTFQFAEFAFIPDLITLPNAVDAKDCHWPLLKQSSDSLLYVRTNAFDQRTYESQLLGEFMAGDDA